MVASRFKSTMGAEGPTIPAAHMCVDRRAFHHTKKRKKYHDLIHTSINELKI